MASSTDNKFGGIAAAATAPLTFPRLRGSSMPLLDPAVANFIRQQQAMRQRTGGSAYTPVAKASPGRSAADQLLNDLKQQSDYFDKLPNYNPVDNAGHADQALTRRVLEASQPQDTPLLSLAPPKPATPFGLLAKIFSLAGSLPRDAAGNTKTSLNQLLGVMPKSASADVSPPTGAYAAKPEEATEAQRKAGNYPHGHMRIEGLDISIEQPPGSVRKGKDKQGKEWSTRFRDHYGYIRLTTGRDGDHVDCFIKNGSGSFGTVYVIDQKVDGKFDEHKCMLGYGSPAEAKAAYKNHYQAGWKGFAGMKAMTMDEFKRWLFREGRRVKPVADQQTKDEPMDMQGMTDKKAAGFGDALKALAGRLGAARQAQLQRVADYDKLKGALSPRTFRKLPPDHVPATAFDRGVNKALTWGGGLAEGTGYLGALGNAGYLFDDTFGGGSLNNAPGDAAGILAGLAMGRAGRFVRTGRPMFTRDSAAAGGAAHTSPPPAAQSPQVPAVYQGPRSTGTYAQPPQNITPVTNISPERAAALRARAVAP